MATAKKLTTTVSTKGQIILPKPIRQQRRWHPGTQLVVEDTDEGVLLRAALLFAPSRPQDVFGSLRHPGPPRRWTRCKQVSPVKRDGVMLAIDTNLIVRYLAADHPKQSAKARALIDGNDVFVCTAVLLETEWVLRSV